MTSRIKMFSAILQKELGSTSFEYNDQNDDAALLELALSIHDHSLMGKIVAEFNARIDDSSFTENDESDDAIANIESIKPVYKNRRPIHDATNTKIAIATSTVLRTFSEAIRSTSSIKNIAFEIITHDSFAPENEIEFFSQQVLGDTGRTNLLRILIQSTRGEPTKISLFNTHNSPARNGIIAEFSYQSPENKIVKNISEALSTIAHSKAVIAAAQKAGTMLVRVLRQIDSIPQYAKLELHGKQESEIVNFAPKKEVRLRSKSDNPNKKEVVRTSTISRTRKKPKFSATVF